MIVVIRKTYWSCWSICWTRIRSTCITGHDRWVHYSSDNRSWPSGDEIGWRPIWSPWCESWLHHNTNSDLWMSSGREAYQCHVVHPEPRMPWHSSALEGLPAAWLESETECLLGWRICGPGANLWVPRWKLGESEKGKAFGEGKEQAKEAKCPEPVRLVSGASCRYNN